MCWRERGLFQALNKLTLPSAAVAFMSQLVLQERAETCGLAKNISECENKEKSTHSVFSPNPGNNKKIQSDG